jgi:hypothetical protein
MNFTSEMVLEGIAKAGSKGKCTPMGRAAMSLDLQVPAQPPHKTRQTCTLSVDGVHSKETS